MSVPDLVRCSNCGGVHAVFACPGPRAILWSEIDAALARADVGIAAERAATEALLAHSAERKRAPSALCAPPGECEYCDRRRAYAAASSMRRWRAEKAGDSG
jgi:hypothetical protein